MIRIKNKTFTSGFTHGGKFHADDVGATALLQILDPEFIVVRGYNTPLDRNVLVFDIGNGTYDHHIFPKEKRVNMIEYAAMGKIWRDIGNQFNLTEEQQAAFDYAVVQPIDLNDNSGEPNTFSALISALNTNWNDDPAANDKKFFEAVEISKKFFSAWFARAKAETDALVAVGGVLKDSPTGLAICESYVPAECFPEDVKFVLSPSLRGGWQAISRKKKPILFPEAWRGSHELPMGVTFCHTAGFLACFENKDKAIEWCEKLYKEAV